MISLDAPKNWWPETLHPAAGAWLFVGCRPRRGPTDHPPVSERKRISRLFRIDRAAAPGAPGKQREMVGNPRAGPEARVACHELRQVVAGLRVAAEARERHERAELAPLEFDAAVNR